MTKVKRMAKVYDITSEEIDDFPKHSPVSKREEYIIEALEYYGEVREGRNIKEKVVFVCEHIEKMSENQTINVANCNAMKYNKFVREAIKMNERLKEARKNLKLSQEFVAKQMGITRTAIVAIEAGTRKVTTEELTKFAELYGVTSEELLYGRVSEENEVRAFARTFAELSDMDKKEIMNLINFKRRYKETMN